MTVAITLALLLQFAGGVPSPTEPGSIEGTVLRSGTRQPVPDASVVLISDASADPENWTQNAASVATRTDARGRFVFRNVEPGTFMLTFSASGYVRQEYGQRTFPGRGALIRVVSGQPVQPLEVGLTPTGSVSGTVRDADGLPLTGVPIRLMRPTYDVNGDRMLRPFAAIAQTDDRGQYRIFFVTPGSYYINAGTPQGPPGTGDTRLGPNEIRNFYTSRYYPGAADIAFASTIDIRPGADMRGIDFTLARQEGVRVIGRIIDGATGQASADVDVDLIYRDPGTGWDYGLDYRGRTEAVYEDGRFEFRNVLPGAYTLTASVDEVADPDIRSDLRPKRMAYTPVRVADSDVEGIAVTLVPGTALSGQVRVEGANSVADAFLRDSPLGVTLEPMENGARPRIPGLPEPTYGGVAEDGSFIIGNVLPGEYRLAVTWLRENFYVKSARFGSRDILTEPFEFTSGEGGILDILMSPGVAMVEGVVTDDSLSPVAGAQVVLIPERSRHRPELFKAVQSDQNGRFTMPNIAPGSYKLYAWEAIEPYGWFDLERAARYEPYAVGMDLGESAHMAVNVTLIPFAPR